MTHKEGSVETFEAAHEEAGLKPDLLFLSGFLTKSEADDLMFRIKANAEFRQYDSGCFGNPRPRFEAWYGSWDYQYSRGETLMAQAC